MKRVREPPVIIEGLQLEEDFVTTQEEEELLKHIDASEWNTKLNRMTQHYGFEYVYASTTSTATTPIPEWCNMIIDRLLEKKLLSVRPDQMIVNEYIPGQGIGLHTDHVKLFADGIVSVSLGSDIMMGFQNTETKEMKHLSLPTRSALVLHGVARYKWRHGIKQRSSDGGVKRGRRVSMTFRKMK